MVDLLPCPFCGGKTKVTGYRSCDCCGKAYNGAVGCSVCEAEVSHLDTDAEAIARWNTRATSARIAALEGVLREEEAYLLRHFDADCGIMPGDVEGSFHRLRAALASTDSMKGQDNG